MKIKVIRKYLLPTYTIGNMFIDDVFFSNTLEDTVRDLKDLNNDGDFMDSGEGKIYGQTAIPAGTYKVTLVYWKKRNGLIPLLLDVPGFTGILIHSGSNPLHTEGCILVGENKVKGGLINSKYYETEITKRIKTAIDNKESVWIEIINN